MLKQHPIPQNVTSFQFKLVGEMTLKQFGYLAGGAILAYIAYNLPLPFFFTWPLAALFALGGIGFAFVPIEQRPMDVWFMSFIKSVYSPTLYIWQREPPHKPNSPAAPPPSLPVTGITLSSKNILDMLFMKKKNAPEKTSPVLTPNPTTPSQPPRPTPAPTIQTSPVQPPEKEVSRQYPISPIQTSPTHPPKKEEPPRSDLEKKLEKALEENRKLEEELASIKKMLQTQQQIMSPSPNKPIAPTPFVQKPAPNMISGIVKQQTGEVLHSILVTVKDKDDVPLRALKTNKMGQFASSTPLPNGVYAIDIEDPKGIFFFQPIEITLTGQSMDPLIIVAKSKQDLERQKLADALFGKKG
jgi:hypothetical protein